MEHPIGFCDPIDRSRELVVRIFEIDIMCNT
jgi:hypothetical protein